MENNFGVIFSVIYTQTTEHLSIPEKHISMIILKRLRCQASSHVKHMCRELETAGWDCFSNVSPGVGPSVFQIFMDTLIQWIMWCGQTDHTADPTHDLKALYILIFSHVIQILYKRQDDGCIRKQSNGTTIIYDLWILLLQALRISPLSARKNILLLGCWVYTLCKNKLMSTRTWYTSKST